MNHPTNQTDVFGNQFVKTQPSGDGSQPLYNNQYNNQNNNQMQGMQQVPQNQVYQTSVYQNSNGIQPMSVPNFPFQGQMGMNGNQGGQAVYPNPSYVPEGPNGTLYTTGGGNAVGQMYQQSMPTQTPFVENNTQVNYGPFVNQNPSLRQVESVEKQEEIVKPTDSFTEMAFAGVNQQEEGAKEVTVLTSEKPSENQENPVEVSVAENMQPVEKKADENAGLKFLGIIFLILIVVIFCLPLIGLN